MSESAVAPPVPVSVVVAEHFLNGLLDEARASGAFPRVIERSAEVSTLGVLGASLHLEIVDAHIRLLAGSGGRGLVDVGMRGAVIWEAALGRVTQALDVSFTLGVTPSVRLAQTGPPVVGADFASARVDDVRVTVLETSYLPGRVTSDLIGPVGRRLLDRISQEAIQVAVRGVGEAEAALDPLLGEWLRLLGAPAGPAAVSVLDGALLVRPGGGAETVPDGLGEANLPAVRVDVTAGAVPGLLDVWVDSLWREDAVVLASPEFAFVAGAVDVRFSAQWRRLPVLVPRLHVRLAPRVAGDRLTFAVEDAAVAVPGFLGWLAAPLRRVLIRSLAGQLVVDARFTLPLPLGADGTWLLGIESVDVDPVRVVVSLDAWFRSV